MDDGVGKRLLRDAPQGPLSTNILWDRAIAEGWSLAQWINSDITHLYPEKILIAEDMQYMGPVRVSDVESAQQRIVDVVRRLEDMPEALATDTTYISFDRTLYAGRIGYGRDGEGRFIASVLYAGDEETSVIVDTARAANNESVKPAYCWI